MGNTQKSHLFLLLSFPLFLILAAFSSQVSSFTTDFPILDRPTKPLPEERVLQLFQEWKQKHGKIYKNEKEEEMRLENFIRNVKYIVEKNSKRKSDSNHLIGLNNFADMSNEEFRQVHTSKITMPFNKKNNTISANSCDAPPSKDWKKHGAVTEVEDLGGCGCEGGLMDPAIKFVINNGGIDSAVDYPYTESRGTCSYKK